MIGRYYPHVDGVRALAVCAVIAFHLGLGLPGGFVGVDVFFVISGFLITGIIAGEIRSTGTFRFGNFYIRRVRRLFPALFTTLTLCLIVGATTLPPDRMKSLAGSIIASIFSLSNIYFWSQSGYFDVASSTKPLLHTWSLSVEEQFYLVWPASLFTAALLWRKGIAALVVVAGLGSFALNVAFPLVSRTSGAEVQSAMFFLPFFRVFEFAIGAAALWWFRRPMRNWAFILGFGAIGISLLAFDESTPFPSFAALLPCSGAALLILARDARLTSLLLENPVVVWIGKLSYSLYLVHWPVIVFWPYFTDRAVPPFPALVLTVALACLLYYFVERPLRRPDTYVSHPRFLAAALFSTAVVSVTGASATANGWTWRYPKDILELVASAKPSIAPPACFLTQSEPPEHIAPRCFTPVNNGKLNILLAGDSTAAAFYPGLLAAIEDRANLLLWSASACPPILGFSYPQRPLCGKVNDALYATLKQRRYDLVIFITSTPGAVIAQHFPKSREFLDRNKIPYLFAGAGLRFSDPLPDLVARYGRMNGLDAFVTTHLLWPCTDEQGYPAIIPPARFVSMKASFCIDGMAKYKDKNTLYFADELHLSDAGALYAGQEMSRWLLAHGFI